MNVLEFDQGVLAELQKIQGVKVYDSVRPDEDEEGKIYVVFFGNDVLPGEASRHRPITGYLEASVLHPFNVLIAAPTPAIRNKVVNEVRRRILSYTVDGASEVKETGQLNSYGDTDNTLKPVRYTYYVTFQVTLDRSV